MTIRYLSEHDSPDDPGGLIREALGMGDDFAGPAEDLVLAWVLRLGEDRDPAEAAQRLIADYQLDAEPQPRGACGRLVGLLRETADFPAARRGHICRPRRRGGWRRNRP